LLYDQWMRDFFKSETAKQLTLLVLVAGFLFLTWNRPELYAFQMLTVFFHEASHALMVVATGGEVTEFSLDPRRGGHVKALGGNGFLISSAGYLGSGLWGAFIYILAARSRWDRWALGILGAAIILITLYFGAQKFALFFGLAFGVGAIVIAKFLSDKICDILLRITGLTSLLYAPLDIYSDVIDRTHLKSDAYNIAQAYGGSAQLWGIIWIVISAILIAITLKLSVPKFKRQAAKS